MNALVIFIAVLGMASANYTCSKCADITWSNTTLATSMNLSSTVDGYSSCSSAGSANCTTGQECGNATVVMSVGGTSSGVAWTFPFSLAIKNCVASTETCDTFEAAINYTLEASDSDSEYTWSFSDCDLSICNENVTTCVSGAATISLLSVAVFSVLRLL
jgi:hypothetical protein